MGQTIDSFIAHWKGASGGERSQSQSFLRDFCQVLGVEPPNDGDYKFEYPVPGDRGTDFIDLYKKGCFVLEAKQSRAKGQKKALGGQLDLVAPDEAQPTRERSNRAWDVLMLNARQQAENYARHLPASHEWPPFIVVCDVGHCFELYADFTGKGRNYSQFPDRKGFRIFIDDLAKPETRELFVKLWTDPHALDPAKRAAKATREIAERLAAVSKRLEARKLPPEEVALFLMRAIFTMFAEDAELLPKDSFSDLMQRCIEKPQMFAPELEMLWKAMDEGGYAPAAQAQVKRFNGFLFKHAKAFALEREEIGELAQAAKKDWREVDPSIFGTLLEQALDPVERARLGAHYTPRAYVERLVIATVIEPLREDWGHVLATAERLKSEKQDAEAIAVVQAFHGKLFNTRVLDPACGTGNFLYVTLELMKRLEGEVLETLVNLGGQEALKGFERHEVDPHQFLGMEVNARARHIAELVLWLGYLQWHIRTNKGLPSDPVLKDYRTIEHRDAVLAHDGVDAKGNYRNPRRPDWPEADYIVGNPPFIGKGAAMREALGDSYVEALWSAHPQMNESADFVMYWWDRAAELLTAKSTHLKRFGLVTTNSITQVFNRRVVERHCTAKEAISIVMAIPDHPWTKATPDAAAVRIAMTVGEAGKLPGLLREVIGEADLDSDEPRLRFKDAIGHINADLTIGADLTACGSLLANEGIACNGMMLAGRGFVLSDREAAHLRGTATVAAPAVIKKYINGGELVRSRSHRYVIDLFGYDIGEVRDKFPAIYQHILTTVKPERDQNRRAAFRRRWWVFGEPRRTFRPALEGLSRYVGTTETAKHRIFQFLDAELLPDHMIIAIASADAFNLGVLSSRVHVTWALRAGGWLGVGNDPRYSKSRCLDPFPFPDADPVVRARIADLAERLDRHRKQVQAAHPQITLTQMYNVLEKLRSAPHPALRATFSPQAGRRDKEEEADISVVPSPREAGRRSGEAGDEGLLTPDECRIRDDGLILILRELHDELDAAVADAYGWPAALSDDEILARLVALNKERAAEEAKGLVRWLRPDYQIPRFGTTREREEQIEADLGIAAVAKAKPSFPKEAVAQTAAVMSVLAGAASPLAAGDIAQGFKQGRKVEDRVRATLISLARTGYISVGDGGRRFSLRRAA